MTVMKTTIMTITRMPRTIDSLSLCVSSMSIVIEDVSLILTNYAWKQGGEKSFEIQILIFELGGRLRFVICDFLFCVEYLIPNELSYITLGNILNL